MRESYFKQLRHRVIKYLIIFLLLFLMINGIHCQAGEVTAPKNVLFIAVDDLRPQLGCYGNEQMITPNIDLLAAQGLMFERAYCQQAICSPSRISLLTGLRCETTKIYGLERRKKDVLPDIVSLPQHFKNNGYETISIGKIYHHANDDPDAWTKPPVRKMVGSGYVTEEGKKQVEQSK